MKYSFKTKVREVKELDGLWYIGFLGVSYSVGPEKPEIKVGDTIKITMERKNESDLD